MGGDRAPAFVVGRKSLRVNLPQGLFYIGAWFSDVSWRRVGQTACVAVARKGA